MRNSIYYGLIFLLCRHQFVRGSSPSADTHSSNCEEEFGTCVMNRDCCRSLECVAGDWAVTTDSTCLSRRSQALNNLNEEEKVKLITSYYQSLPQSDGGKSLQKVQNIVAKYERRFAQLVTRLESKYNVPLNDGLAGSETSQEL